MERRNGGERVQERPGSRRDAECPSQTEPAKTFEDLLVWQKAHRLVLAIYRLTDRFPKSETFGLSSQMRRAAVSVPANVAEGFKRRTSADKAHFMTIAEGSLQECRYYLILAQDLEYGDARALLSQLDEVSRLLFAYAEGIRSGPAKRVS